MTTPEQLVTPEQLDAAISYKLRTIADALKSADHWRFHYHQAHPDERGRFTQHWYNAMVSIAYARREVARLKRIKKKLFSTGRAEGVDP
jgi:hypothetical protein